MDIRFENDKIYIENAENFDLAQTFDCGQAFRWYEDEAGGWRGIADGKGLRVYREGECIVLEGTDRQTFQDFWREYLDLDRDYADIIKSVSDNETVRTAAEFGSGIRILNQQPWEALCSFIISQNNNIPRIKGIIERLCEGFGDKIENGYTFPSPENLASLTVEDLAPIRSGFRAKYILDAARKVAGGEIDLQALRHTDFNTAREELMKIKGVGPKVADCVLLFGLQHIEAFPQDVWIKRAISELFDGGIPESSKPFAGIVQQYIFYYMRNRDIK